MSRGRILVLSMALAGLLIAALPALASARLAYVTGHQGEGSEGFATPVQLSNQEKGAQAPIAGTVEGAPPDIAITPDGKTAYVPNGSNAVVPVDVASNTAGSPITVPQGPTAIAIAPDGKTAYVTTFGGVVPIDLQSGIAGTSIPAGSPPIPNGIGITPDGKLAYVVNYLSDFVSVIDLATNSVVASISTGAAPVAVAMAPDGSTVYVAEDEGVLPISVATNTAGTPITGLGGGAFGIAISPNGLRGYLLEGSGEVVPFALPSGTPGSPISPSAQPWDIAIQPDGTRAYVTTGYPLEEVVPIDIPADVAGGPFDGGENPNAIAIVPNQPPHAAFTPSPSSVAAGGKVSFDAGGSTDSDGSVARYDWSFGDGSTASNAGPTPSHTYSSPGSYQVTLTTTDNEGCSLSFVFTGQTAYCNGSSVARTSRTVTVTETTQCPKVTGGATTFVPKLRSSHVVPGVRVRLVADKPAHLDVKSTLIWFKEGEEGHAKLRHVSVNVNRWRRIRLPLPKRLRHRLPLGQRVKVSLKIHATPRDGSACVGSISNPTLRVRVVKVIPKAVQFARLSR